MNRFRLGILLRVLLLSGTVLIFIWLAFHQKRYIGASMFGLMIPLFIYNLFLYVEGTNRKLTRFFESIRFSDFEVGFQIDDQKGKSFRNLNASFNQVLEAFRETRAESEEHLHYLNTLVYHIRTGILAFDSQGKLNLQNPAASRLLGIPRIQSLTELQEYHPELPQILQGLSHGNSTLYRRGDKRQLALHATELRLRGQQYILVSIQNIQRELQQKELESWQNLARTLRHEIVNSVTPIVSLVETLQEIVEQAGPITDEPLQVPSDSWEDIRESLTTIERRSKALIRFVNAYKHFTRIPEPHFMPITLGDFLRQVEAFIRPEMEVAGVAFEVHTDYPQHIIEVDEELLEMVLLNLLKNAREALVGHTDPRIRLTASSFSQQEVEMAVSDNGPGIIPQALEKIFIPFFTTKSAQGGTGIGLSIARQIIQMHGGSLAVQSVPNQQTVFQIRLPDRRIVKS